MNALLFGWYIAQPGPYLLLAVGAALLIRVALSWFKALAIRDGEGGDEGTKAKALREIFLSSSIGGSLDPFWKRLEALEGESLGALRKLEASVQEAAGEIESDERVTEKFQTFRLKTREAIAGAVKAANCSSNTKRSLHANFKMALHGCRGGPGIADYWLPFLIGLLELLSYPILIFTNNLAVIGAWLTLKTAAQWATWGKSRTTFNRFLFGNLLAIVAAFALAGWFVRASTKDSPSVGSPSPDCASPGASPFCQVLHRTSEGERPS